MKYKVLRIILIGLGLIPFIWLFYESMEVYYSSFLDIPDYLVGALINILIYPWVLLGLIPIFIGVLLPSDKKVDVPKKNTKSKRILWWILLVIGALPITIPLILSIFSFFFGFTFIFSTSYGVEGMFDSLFVWSFLFWPTYVIGLFLIILSVIKIRKNN